MLRQKMLIRTIFELIRGYDLVIGQRSGVGFLKIGLRMLIVVIVRVDCLRMKADIIVTVGLSICFELVLRSVAVDFAVAVVSVCIIDLI